MTDEVRQQQIQLKEVIQELEDLLQIPLFLVGGAVRDFLLGQNIKDWDFTTSSSPDDIEAAIKKAGKKSYNLGKKYGTVGCKHLINGESNLVEITTFRQETYTKGSRKPQVDFTDSLEQDLSRRDLTFNAMAVNSQGQIIDPFGGRQDLEQKIVRTVGEARGRFGEDPLRILRAVRFAASLQATIEAETKQTLHSMRYELLNISRERWVMELDKMLGSHNAITALELLQASQIIQVILPELAIISDSNWQKTLFNIEKINPQEIDRRWGALLSLCWTAFDTTEEAATSFAQEIAARISLQLHFSGERQKTIQSYILSQTDL
jgi:tRNA nucleotidyltransferase/poly(A) polymerase